VVVCVSNAVFTSVLCLCWCSVVFFVCGSGGKRNLLETSVVNMSDNAVIRLYLCSFSLEIALEKCFLASEIGES
jgi:hypothetical protein